jgi:hypothetical protein
LTGAQERVLVALVCLCPEIGRETTLHPVAQRAGLTPGPAMLALRGLERRRMVWKHDADGETPGPTWTPTQGGLEHAEAVRPLT